MCLWHCINERLEIRSEHYLWLWTTFDSCWLEWSARNSSTLSIFRSANFPGTIASLAAFADGLFGLNGHQQVEFENIDEPDVLLSPHLNCSVFANITTGKRIRRSTWISGNDNTIIVDFMKTYPAILFKTCYTFFDQLTLKREFSTQIYQLYY